VGRSKVLLSRILIAGSMHQRRADPAAVNLPTSAATRKRDRVLRHDQLPSTALRLQPYPLYSRQRPCRALASLSAMSVDWLHLRCRCSARARRSKPFPEPAMLPASQWIPSQAAATFAKSPWVLTFCQMQRPSSCCGPPDLDLQCGQEGWVGRLPLLVACVLELPCSLQTPGLGL
jgi:hypothetical protein